MKIRAAVLIAFGINAISSFASAAPFHSLKKNEIDALVASVPVSDKTAEFKNLAERLRSLNWAIKGGDAYSYDTKAELEQPADKVGDVHFSIQTTEPTEEFKKRFCATSGRMVSFLKRDRKFYPESRAANWLMTGNCSTNFPKPKG